MGKMALDLLPRQIRLRDAPRYLGMDKNRFNAEVRPYLTEIPVGKQGVGFDRLDLDRWFEEYKACNGRPGKQKGVTKPWRGKRCQGSSNVVRHGTLRSDSEEAEFEKAVALAISKKRKDI
ncbi:MAG: hypothetical protein ACLP5H_13480 [Desulfomonilaceae bacterium]